MTNFATPIGIARPLFGPVAVTTKFTLDLAASVPLEVPEGPVDVRVVLPERGIEQVIEALVAGETYVVARVENDQLVLEQLAEAPYYL